MSQINVNQINPVSPTGTVNFTGANPPTWNGTPLGTGGGGSGGSGGGPANGYVDPRPLGSPPPAPTNLTAIGGFRTIILNWDLVDYINHSFCEIYRNTINDRTSSTLVGKSTSNAFNDTSVLASTTYYYWVRAINIEGSSGSYSSGDTAGVSASILKIGNTDLAAAVVDASKIADGTITAAKMVGGFISSYTQFASGLEPISVVGALPSPSGYTGAKVVFLTTDGKLYRYTGSAWVASVAAADLSGTVSNSQLASGIDASKLTGTLNTALIAAGALDATKFAASIGTITIVASVPGVKSTDVIFNTTDKNLYRWNGTSYVKSVSVNDLSGTLSSSQIADLDAAKLTGTINVSRIAAGALDATKFASSIEPVTITSSVPGTKSTNVIFNTTDGKMYRWNGSAYVKSVATSELTGTISNSQIADGSISGTKFASGVEAISTVSSVPGAKTTNMVFNTTDGKLYRWTGASYVATVPGSDVIGSVSTVDIADGSIGLTKFASGIEPMSVVASVPGTKSTNLIFNTTDGKVYRWNGTAYIKAVDAADITVGQITGTQIADGSISTPKLVAGSINANVLSAGTITSNLITANTLNGDRLLANSIDAGKIVAGTITATQIAASGITGDKIAANTITANKIQSNTLTSTQILAGSITGDRIAANTIDAGKIVAGTLTATQIAAGGITGDRIAAGTITADKLQANSITSAQIAAGSISGDRIAADSITAGQIQAGAVGASEIAAFAITTNKLLVTGQGSALNDDPSFTDMNAWPLEYGSMPTQVATTTGPAGLHLVRFSVVGSIRSRYFFVSPNRTYRLQFHARKTGGTGPGTYARIAFMDANYLTLSSAVIDYNNPPSTFENFTLTSTWTKYSGYAVAPANAVQARIVFYGNYPSDSTGITEVQDLRCDEYIGSDLIVDGAITTNKMTANSINGDRIIANSLAASKIVAGSITTDRFTANTIGGSILQDGTITANKLVANSITAGQIQAGAIGAAQISAGAITASKLTVANQDSAFPDPGWYDTNFIFDTNYYTPVPGVFGVSDTGSGWPSYRTLCFNGNISSFDFFSAKFPIELGATYRFKVHVYVTSSFSGTFGAWVHFPQQAWFDMGVTRSASAMSNGLFPVSLTRDTWHTFTSTFTNSSTVLLASNTNTFSHFRFAGQQTAGTVYIGIEMVRASGSDLIVDGAITTNKMTANSINGDRISVNTLNGDRLVANSITAGQIQAGAIGASQIAAGAITVGKLAVTGNSDSIWIDRNFQDPSIWNIDATPTFPIQATISDGIAGGTSMRSVTGSPSSAYGKQTVATTVGKRYKYSAYIRRNSAANGIALLRINKANSSSSALDYWNTFTSLDSITPTTNWVKYSAEFVAQHPFAAPLVILNQGGTAGYIEVQDIRIEEMIVGSDLIVDGTITASKIQVGTIVAGSGIIANGAITNALIADAVIDAAKIADLTVTNAKIANGTIQSAKIASVDAGTITAGTLNAARIGAGSIDASKISVSSLSSLTAEIGNAVISTSGSIRSGQTAWNSGTGWWWGIDSGIPKMSIGNPGTAFMRWTGTDLELTNVKIVSPQIVNTTLLNVGDDVNTTVSFGNSRTVVTRQAVISMSAPAIVSYSWTFIDDGSDPGVTFSLLNATTNIVTVKVSASYDPIGPVGSGIVRCTTVDINGIVAVDSFSVFVDFF
jgi:hypothetical protein